MKKLIVLALVSAMLLSAFSGCKTDTATSTSSDAVSGSDSTAASGSSTGETATATSDNPNFNPTGLPIVKEKESFTLMADDGGLPEDKFLLPLIEEQTNVHVKLILFPYEIALEKKNILINSGDYPDVIGGWIMKEPDILNDGMNDDLYIPLNGLIDSYAPKLQEALNVNGARKEMTLPDGNIYTIPYVIDQPKVSHQPMINTEWLEKANMEMPKTTEEFRELLRYFRDNDMDGDGNASNEIPYSGDTSNNNMNFGFMAGWFGKSVDKYGFTMVNGKLEFGANSEEYKESMKYFNSLYTEGLIDPEIFTQDKAQWKAKGKEGIVGVNMAYHSQDWLDTLLPGDTTPWRGLPVLKGNDKEPVWLAGTSGSQVFRTQAVITDKAKNPEVIIRWWDNAFEFENSVQFAEGPIGKMIEITAENDARLLDLSLLTEEEVENYDWKHRYVQSLPRFIPPGFRIKPMEGNEVPYHEKDPIDALYEPYLVGPIPNAWVSAEESKTMTTIKTDIENYIYQKQAEWISGQSNIDEDWDTYLAQLDKYGLPELMDIRTKAIDAMA